MGESLPRTLARNMLGGSTLDTAESIVDQAKHQSMSLLSFLDDQLYTLGELVETRFNSVLSVVLRRSSAADVSSDCERKTDDTLLRLLSPLVYIVYYVFGLASAWLLQRSQIEDKHQLQATEEHDEYQQHSYVESKLSGEDHHDKKPELVDTPQDFVKEKVDDLKEQDSVKEKVIDDGALKEQQHDEEPDELTKLFDASWSLGAL